MKRFHRLALGVAVAIGVASIVFLLRHDGNERVEPSTDVDLTLDAPANVPAGDSWRIAVSGATGGALEVVVVGPWGTRRLAPADVTRGVVTVSGELTQRSGRLVAIVSAGESSAAVGVDVVAGPAVDGVTPLAGPRSMTADGDHWTMVTAIARDEFGNALPDGAPVDVLARRPDGTIDRIGSEMEGLLAAMRVASGTLAGRTVLRVDAAGSTGAEVEVLEVPGPPVEVVLAEPSAALRADGRSLAVVATERLVDRHGNELLDGTVAIARLAGPSGLGTVRSVTVDGRAEFVVEAPVRSGVLTVEVHVDGVASAPIEIAVAADVAEVPVRVEPIGGGRFRLAVGPVLTSLGGFVPDGTEVVIASGGVDVAAGVVRDGAAELTLSASSGDRVVVDVLDATAGVTLP